jgi:hypothetical protein
MPEVTTVVDRYVDFWNEPDADRRRALAAEVWTDDAHYLDPLMEGTGAATIADMVGAVQAQYPGTEFRLVAGPDAHHDRVRFTWQLVVQEAGTVLATGFDFGTVAEDGRLQDVTGFLELAQQ